MFKIQIIRLENFKLNSISNLTNIYLRKIKKYTEPLSGVGHSFGYHMLGFGALFLLEKMITEKRKKSKNIML